MVLFKIHTAIRSKLWSTSECVLKAAVQIKLLLLLTGKQCKLSHRGFYVLTKLVNFNYRVIKKWQRFTGRRFWNHHLSQRLLSFACEQSRCGTDVTHWLENHINRGLSTLCLKTHTAKAAALPCLVFPAPHHLPVVSPNPPNQSLFSDNMYILAMKADFKRGKS